MPSHEAGRDNSNSPTARLAKGLVKSNNLIDATNCIQRFRTIQKLAKGGDRNLEVHVNSVHIVNPELIKGKTVLLLDDVMTTGNSLRACRKLLLRWVLAVNLMLSKHRTAMVQTFIPS